MTAPANMPCPDITAAVPLTAAVARLTVAAAARVITRARSN